MNVSLGKYAMSFTRVMLHCCHNEEIKNGLTIFLHFFHYSLNRSTNYSHDFFLRTSIILRKRDFAVSFYPRNQWFESNSMNTAIFFWKISNSIVQINLIQI